MRKKTKQRKCYWENDLEVVEPVSAVDITDDTRYKKRELKGKKGTPNE